MKSQRRCDILAASLLSRFGLLRWVMTYLDLCYNTTSFERTASSEEESFEHSFQIRK